MKRLKFDEITLSVLPNRVEMGKEAAREAADYVVNLLNRKQSLRCVFAAAPSQSDFLNCFFADKRIDFGRIEAFHMDEYIGLPSEDSRSFTSYLKQFFNDVKFKDVNFINSMTNPEEECVRYGEMLMSKPIDIVFMGIGENGHIAFNDPDVAKFDDNHIMKPVQLDLMCRNQQVNDGCFASLEQVPNIALTLTVPTLLSAEKHFCFVPGVTKAKALSDVLLGEIGEHCPATALRHKPGVMMYVDEDCFSITARKFG